jgi:hypothetical protein
VTRRRRGGGMWIDNLELAAQQGETEGLAKGFGKRFWQAKKTGRKKGETVVGEWNLSCAPCLSSRGRCVYLSRVA